MCSCEGAGEEWKYRYWDLDRYRWRRLRSGFLSLFSRPGRGAWRARKAAAHRAQRPGEGRAERFIKVIDASGALVSVNGR